MANFRLILTLWKCFFLIIELAFSKTKTTVSYKSVTRIIRREKYFAFLSMQLFRAWLHKQELNAIKLIQPRI